MRNQAVICAVIAASLTAPSLAFAQASNFETQLDEARRAGNTQTAVPDCRDQRLYRHDPARRGQPVPGAWQDARAGGPARELREGQLLPRQFRSRQFVVEDWRAHLLCAPPQGYQWVQMGADYVLVAIATGIILQLLLNN